MHAIRCLKGTVITVRQFVGFFRGGQRGPRSHRRGTQIFGCLAPSPAAERGPWKVTAQFLLFRFLQTASGNFHCWGVRMNSGGALESFRGTGSRGFGVSHLTACCFLIQDGPLSPEAGPLVYTLTRVGSLLDLFEASVSLLFCCFIAAETNHRKFTGLKQHRFVSLRSLRCILWGPYSWRL